MTESNGTTIAALATAPYPAGIAVVRISGAQSKTALRALFRAKINPVDQPRKLILGELIDHKSGQVIDKALAVYMPDPHSYTGEDIAEFQFHGSPVLVQKILRSLFSFGISPAEPGEFTKRAFLNGKMDLIQAEAISEVINASSEQALKIAGEHLKGKLSSVIHEVGEPLRDTLAEIEASIDFPEEEIDPKTREGIKENLEKAFNKLGDLLKTYSYGHILRDGFRVLLCGRPNVGKSSILNLLLGKDRAIVTEISGTTRDLIEENAILGGYQFVFCDSAGLTEPNDKVEMKGIELAKERIPWADLVLFVVDSSDKSDDWKNVLDYLRENAKKIWMITNKIDLNPNAIATFFCDSQTCAQNFYISARTRDGLDSLTQALIDEVSQNLTDHAEGSMVVTNERQRNCLVRGEQAIESAINAIKDGLPLEIISSEIRVALAALDEIVGKTYADDILGRIFSKFCIGK